jgi:transcriptional regulator with XRE-family HTH domain
MTKQAEAGGSTPFARLLGKEIKRRRIALRLSQAEAGAPLSRAFLSSIECGRMTPSLPSLVIIARRLNSSAAAILASVEAQLEDL